MSTFDVLKQEAPEVMAGFGSLIQALSNVPSLDGRLRHLIYIGMKVVTNDPDAVVAHVPMARAAGATREEIRDTILLSLSVTGLRGINTCLVKALEAWDQAEAGTAQTR